MTSQLNTPRDSFNARSPREDKNKNPTSLEEDIEHFKNSFADLENFQDKLNDDAKQPQPVKHSAESPRAGAESEMTARTDENIISEKQLRKNNAHLNELRPLLVEYPRKLEELKRVVHTIKIRHVAEISKLKRRFKEELDRKVQDARDEERERMRKEMEDLRNETEKNKVKWMNATSKLKAESNKLERAQERLNRAENQTQGNRMELLRSVDLLKKEVQRTHRDLITSEREKRLERIRADKAEDEVKKLQSKLEIFTKGRLHNRAVAAEERVVDVEHKYEVLEWKFRSVVNVVNDLYRQNTPASFDEVNTLQDLLDTSSEGYSRFPDITESQRPTAGHDRKKTRRRRARTPESVKLPEIAGATSEYDKDIVEGKDGDEKPKTPDADTESTKASSRPQSQKSNTESDKGSTEGKTVTDGKGGSGDDVTKETENPDEDNNGATKENIFLTETRGESRERQLAEKNSSLSETSPGAEAKTDENTAKENDAGKEKQNDADGEDSDKEEYERQLAALKKKRNMKKKK
ncbi:dynein regulatory complex subunit 4-like [Ptychodera flava]|uniref:dynein regulatory complex subunit 4-like n=1 Tax=Ptychodera flava TaxID=63121 RepID=UPI003969CFE4